MRKRKEIHRRTIESSGSDFVLFLDF